MKGIKLILAMIGVSLLLVAASAQAGPLFGNSRVVDIAFTGYCDGLHMTINYNTGQVIANRTGGCVTATAMWGTVGALLDGSYKGGAVTLMNPATGEAYSPYYAVILDKPQIWIYYLSGGVVLNSGAYTVGTPAAEPQGQGLLPSTTPRQ